MLRPGRAKAGFQCSRSRHKSSTLRPAHLPTAEQIASWPAFSKDHPLRILASGGLPGQTCGYDATTYGDHPMLAKLFGLPNVRVFNFCPEDFSFRTPRAVGNIHGGDGSDVPAGRATVKTDDGHQELGPPGAARDHHEGEWYRAYFEGE
jgi:hypothetical protein